LIEHMSFLLSNYEEASRMGRNARAVAQERFGLDRFISDWNKAFALVIQPVHMY
jgi:glycosyltransferase involved in cell wall biosynthesis